jgi:hypothetical protein
MAGSETINGNGSGYIDRSPIELARSPSRGERALLVIPGPAAGAFSIGFVRASVRAGEECPEVPRWALFSVNQCWCQKSAALAAHVSSANQCQEIRSENVPKSA